MEIKKEPLNNDASDTVFIEEDAKIAGEQSSECIQTDDVAADSQHVTVNETFATTASVTNVMEISTAITRIGKYSQPCTTTSASSLQFVTSSTTNEWYTPARYVTAIKEVFDGRIELDPASCATANEVVRAERYYSITEDGLSQPWHSASLFLNSPYGSIGGRSQAGVWAHRLISEFKSGNVREAVLLVNASTSEAWFQPLYNYPICFTNRRISFYGENGKGSAPTKGSAFIYFGENADRFASVFSSHNIGRVVVPFIAAVEATRPGNNGIISSSQNSRNSVILAGERVMGSPTCATAALPEANCGGCGELHRGIIAMAKANPDWDECRLAEECGASLTTVRAARTRFREVD
jgi:hypothetical protein